jgi:hypothetical protein
MCRTKQAGLCLICGTKTTFFDGQDLGLWMAGLALERLVEVIEIWSAFFSDTVDCYGGHEELNIMH